MLNENFAARSKVNDTQHDETFYRLQNYVKISKQVVRLAYFKFSSLIFFPNLWVATGLGRGSYRYL